MFTATTTAATTGKPSSNGDAADSVDGLPHGRIAPRHVRRLRESGLDDDTIIESNIISTAPQEYERVARLLNIEDWKAKKFDGGMIIPYFDRSRKIIKGFARFKPDHPYTPPDGKPHKYLSPTGARTHIYHPNNDAYH